MMGLRGKALAICDISRYNTIKTMWKGRCFLWKRLHPFRSPRRRRRKRTKLEIFKEIYLPYVIAAVAAAVVLFISVGAIHRAVEVHKVNAAIAKQESLAAAELAAQQTEEAARLIQEAEALAAGYDYDAAIAKLDSFTGDLTGFSQLLSKRGDYVQAKSEMVAWSDPGKITNLSFQLLIADPARAFADEEYGEAYNRNYVTTDEFSKILQQLYDNGYILVSMRDMVTSTVNEDGSTSLSAATLYLPNGKKPLVLTQCGVNYYTYMTDGDGDGLPDKDGAGFASRLTVDGNGRIVNEMIDTEGNSLTGAFDLVPILDAFIEEHPDFSYRGARAVLAVTGYDGVFGYRTDSDTMEDAEADYYNEQVMGAQTVVQALRDEGYEIACYSYDHLRYGDQSASSIEDDLDDWSSEVTPVLGDVGILVYPYGSDIEEYHADAYSGDRFDVLRDAGFRYFVGMDNSTPSWADVNEDYFRQTRRLVSGVYMAYTPEMFSDLFDASLVLNPQRGTVPQE